MGTSWLRYISTIARKQNSLSDWSNSWINGNNGITSNKFAKEHPYWSMAANLAGDAVVGGGLWKRKDIVKAFKNKHGTPSINVTTASDK